MHVFRVCALFFFGNSLPIFAIITNRIALVAVIRAKINCHNNSYVFVYKVKEFRSLIHTYQGISACKRQLKANLLYVKSNFHSFRWSFFHSIDVNTNGLRKKCSENDNAFQVITNSMRYFY